MKNQFYRSLKLTVTIFFATITSYFLYSQNCDPNYPENLAGEDKIICINECVTIGCDPVSNYCYKWEPAISLEDPSSSSPNACPLGTTTYTVTITDDNGNFISTSSCTIFVLNSTPPNLDELQNYFQGLNFTVFPIIKIVGPSAITPTISERQLPNCTVHDYANLLFEILQGPNQGLVVDLGMELENNCNNEATYYITSNNSDCAEFSIISQALNTCEEAVVWYHIFETSEPNIPDLLIFGNNSSYVNQCNLQQSGDLGDIIIQGCLNFNLDSNMPVNSSLTGYTYTIVQRAFGPWTDFGHFPLFPGVYLSKNNFVGDNRGFSLGEHKITTDNDPNKASSRVYHSAQIVLGSGNNLIPNPFPRKSSGTIGKKDMMPKGGPCEWNCELTANIGGNEWAENNTLYMRSYGSDPCVFYASNIDMRSKFAFNKVELNGKQYLDVKGMILNKRFPSHEVFISDINGKKVFLYSFGPGGESEIVDPGLLAPRYDEGRAIDFKIQINSSGAFLSEVIVGQSSDVYPFNSNQPLAVYPLTFSPNIILECKNGQFAMVFNYQNYSIDAWNQSNLGKIPAGDCASIPCCGNLGCCDD